MSDRRTILVTSALPYANNSLHLGHLVEYVQTDVWVRYQRLRGHNCIYVCASDAHGTPTMLRAEQQGVSPEQLIATVSAGHRRDFETFGISVDNYLTTHSDENRELTALVFERLQAAGHIYRKPVKQAYDEQKGMFLPDRYVRGTCPVCKTPDQYGDSCENCSATYSPLDLEDAVSVLSGTRPTVRESEHLFFRLSAFETELKAWVPEHVDSAMANKLAEWFEAGLKDWDISRDAPYFGFEVPGHPGKYFYVWFDAPIGYMATFLELCRRKGIDFDAYWAPSSTTELYHFIGKDIVYFHTLFWPSVLSGAGYRKPTRVFVHGFLTIDGQKMSKRRGTFITMETFARHIEPDYLRYYYASKLGPGIDDIDLNLEDFVAKVNADLVGKLVNIASRCVGFVQRLNGGRLAATLRNASLLEEFAAAEGEIASAYEARDYARAMRRIMGLADRANQFIDERKPWQLAKDAERHTEVVEICTLGLNCFRNLIILLKPVLPALAERAEHLFGGQPLTWQDLHAPLLGAMLQRYEPLAQRIDVAAIELIKKESSEAQAAAQTAGGAATQGIEQEAAQSFVDIETFAKLDLRIAQVRQASHVEGADKLLRLELDLGGSTRTVFAGIRAAYRPEDLEGKLVVVVANLAPRKMRFGVSEGMVLAAGDGGREIFLLHPDAGARPGQRVR